MAEAILVEIAKSLVTKIGSQACDAIMSAGDLDSQIKRLQDMRSAVEATLLDAEVTQASSCSQRDVLEKLERGLAKLVDFKEAKATKAKQIQLKGGNRFTTEVRLFLSSSNQLVSPFRDSRTVQSISRQLRIVAADHAQFGTILQMSPVNSTESTHRSTETWSHPMTDIVIGRDEDRDVIINTLSSSSSVTNNLCVASIVGMGGIGKTTLAQYVYNDERVRGSFDAQFWVFACGQELSIKAVLEKILESLNFDGNPLSCGIEQLYRHVSQALAGRKFLLVLDNVWDGRSLRANWLELRALLQGLGGEGSKVLLTTRSMTVAHIMSTVEPYFLDDILEEDCWFLFRHLSITLWHESGLEEIGKEIVKRCPKVPLAVKMIGSLLAEKLTVREWQAFRNDQLANFASYGRDVVSTLKLSFDHLDPRMKLCVAYCSLFPRGFEFVKQQMILFWIALGYVTQQYSNQSLEDAGEDYVICLISRGFFQNPVRDATGCIESFHMHDLMHQLVIAVAGVRYQMADSETCDFDERVNHMSLSLTSDMSVWNVPSSLRKIQHLQSFLLIKDRQLSDFRSWVFSGFDKIVDKFQSLRLLDLSRAGITNVPKSLGRLIHLRYLDLSANPFSKLPSTLTLLVNLVFLNLWYCVNLQELPEDISKLKMLRHLNLRFCSNLSHMPRGIGNLTCLQTLEIFTLGKQKTGSKADVGGGFSELSRLNNLKGNLEIRVFARSKDIVSEALASNLDMKDHIRGLFIRFNDSIKEDEMVIEGLLPNANLKNLRIGFYARERLPSWMRNQQLPVRLPNLVSVSIIHCKGLLDVCSFGRLPYLKILRLCNLENAEYKEEESSTTLFPCLEKLMLAGIPKLKGWATVSGAQGHRQSQNLAHFDRGFPKLRQLTSDNMELVISMARGVLRGLTSFQSLEIMGGGTPLHSVGQNSPLGLLQGCLPNLLSLKFHDLPVLDGFQEFQSISSLETLKVHNCEKLEVIPEWITCLTSLRVLDIQNCRRVKSMPQQMSNLTNLTELYIYNCPLLERRCQEPTGEDWNKIQHIPLKGIFTFDDAFSDNSVFPQTKSFYRELYMLGMWTKAFVPWKFDEFYI